MPSLKQRTARYGHHSVPRQRKIDSSGEVLVGLRPEHISIISESAPGSILAEVRVVAPLGSEVLVEMGIEETTLTARAGPSFRARPGEQVHIAIDMTKTVFFDPSTGINLFE